MRSPFNAVLSQQDTDGDGVGDNADVFFYLTPSETSDMTDGVGDNADVFPEDASETLDSDGDGGDNADVSRMQFDNTGWRRRRQTTRIIAV